MKKIAVLQQESRGLDERIASAVDAVSRERQKLKDLRLSKTVVETSRPQHKEGATPEVYCRDEKEVLEIEIKSMSLARDDLMAKVRAAEARSAKIEKQLSNAHEKLQAMPVAFERDEQTVLSSEIQIIRERLEQEQKNLLARIETADNITKLQTKLTKLMTAIKSQSKEIAAAESRCHEWNIRLGVVKAQLEPMYIHINVLRQRARRFLDADRSKHVPALAAAFLDRRISLQDDEHENHVDLPALVFGWENTAEWNCKPSFNDSHDGLIKALNETYDVVLQRSQPKEKNEESRIQERN